MSDNFARVIVFILGLLFVAWGLGALFWKGMPEVMLWLETFLKTDDPPEPSDFYRLMTRIAGVIFIGMGIFFWVCIFLY